jgi:fibronectin type 3 domain-containing protein
MFTFHVHRYLIFCGMLALAFFTSPGARAQGLPAGSTHSVSLAWQAPSPPGGSGTISGYNIYRSPSSATNYAKLNAALTAGLTYTDASVSAGAGYSYCVTAVDSLGEESACSIPATANVPANPNAPAAPTVTVK